MTGLGGALATAGTVTAAAAAVEVVREARRRSLPPSLPRAVMWLGLAICVIAAPIALVTGRATAAYLMIPGSTVLVAGVVWQVLVRVGLSDLIRPAWMVIGLSIPVAVLALSASPLVFEELAPSPTSGWLFVPGPLLWLLVVWMCLILLVVAVVEVSQAVQAVGPLRVDVVVDGVRVVVGCTLWFGLVVVEPWRPLLPLAPMAIALGMLAGWRNGRSGSNARGLQVSTSQVLDRISDAVVVLGPDGSVADANDRARSLLLLGPAERPGLQRRALLDQELRVAIAQDGERTVTLVDGRVARVRVTTVRELGYPVARIVTARDITELERLRAELHEQASRDPLTGLRNRRHLSSRLNAAMTDAARTRTPFCLAMVDLDNLKQLNDGSGHLVGDRALIAVAGVLRGDKRRDDVVVRAGGDEFMVIMPGTCREHARERAEAWRAAAAAVDLLGDDGDDVGHPAVTLSIGIAQMTPGMLAEDLVNAADEALYVAKTSGRDQVRLTGNPDSVTPA